MMLMHCSAIHVSYPWTSSGPDGAFSVPKPVASLASSLAIKRNATVTTGGRKPFCLGNLGKPLGAPQSLVGLR